MVRACIGAVSTVGPATHRRFRDIFELLHGKPRRRRAPIGSRRALARTAAGLAVKSEAMQALVANGGDVDAEQLVRVSNSLARVLGRLRKRQSAPPAPTIAEIAARHRATKVAAE